MAIAKSLASILICLLLILATHAARAKDKDPSSGTLIMAIGEAPDMYFSWYRWKLRRVGDTKLQSMEMMGASNDFAAKRDFKGEELGRILTQDFPEGDYEFVGFEVDEQAGVTTLTGTVGDFSLPFHIAAGKSTYVGDFMAEVATYRTNFFGKRVPVSIYFVISDKNARDLPVAKMLHPDLSEPIISVVDADAARHPLLSSKVRN